MSDGNLRQRPMGEDHGTYYTLFGIWSYPYGKEKKYIDPGEADSAVCQQDGEEGLQPVEGVREVQQETVQPVICRDHTGEVWLFP